MDRWALETILNILRDWPVSEMNELQLTLWHRACQVMGEGSDEKRLWTERLNEANAEILRRFA